MEKMISAIPNFCEGRNAAVIDEVTAALRRVDHLFVLDVSADRLRNRTVFSLIGPQRAILEAGRLLYGLAREKIDMRKHRGDYPRLGALDVFPIVPVQESTIQEAAKLAEELGRLVAKEFDVPVYLFGEAARSPLRREVDAIREGEYEGLARKLLDPQNKPDYGPDTFDPTFGATIIGARFPLITFMAFFDTKDEEAVAAIAKSVAYAHGGLSQVRTYYGMVPERGEAQVTVKIANYTATPLYRVVELMKVEARRFGVRLKGVDLIGLTPQSVLVEAAQYYLSLRDFTPDKLLETSLKKYLPKERNL